MAQVFIAVSDEGVAATIEALAPAEIRSRRSVVVTDHLPLPSDLPVAFVGWRLTEIMRAIIEPELMAVLRPNDVTVDRLTAVGNGSRVFSTYRASGLGLDREPFRAVVAASRAPNLEVAAETAGYSIRHFHRILARLRRNAAVSEEFRWPLLAPLFAEEESGGPQ